MTPWTTKDIPILEIKALLDAGYEVEVESPDGFVVVSEFIDKGMWDEYRLETSLGKSVRCNKTHLFETLEGWKNAGDLEKDSNVTVLTKDGLEYGNVKRTGVQIPIVDIQVEHENHRYYTAGVSSHNTGVGKTLFMVDWAANLLAMNYNVGYITLEMAEERIAERIDANMMDRTIDEIRELPQIIFDKQIDRIRGKTTGKLKVKEYPTATAHAGHFRFLLDEWAIKKTFRPDILFVDYMNICSSSRFKMGNSINSYTYIKSIAEELRGLAVEKNIPIITATQSNREGFGSSDIEMTNVSESFGTPASADFFFAIQTNEELEKLGQFAVKQLKNRYSDVSMYKRFIIGVNRAKMKLYDVEAHAQTGLVDSGTAALERPSELPTEKFDDIIM